MCVCIDIYVYVYRLGDVFHKQRILALLGSRTLDPT